jgi:hypothetical protein
MSYLYANLVKMNGLTKYIFDILFAVVDAFDAWGDGG